MFSMFTAITFQTAIFYAMIRSVDHMFNPNKERPVTAIPFQQWKDGWFK